MPSAFRSEPSLAMKLCVFSIARSYTCCGGSCLISTISSRKVSGVVSSPFLFTVAELDLSFLFQLILARKVFILFLSKLLAVINLMKKDVNLIAGLIVFVGVGSTLWLWVKLNLLFSLLIAAGLAGLAMYISDKLQGD